MNPLKALCLLAYLVAAVSGTPGAPRSIQHRGNSLNNSLKPTEWLSISELESLPAIDELNLEQLEQMSVDEGANLVNKIYHLSQLSRDIEPSYMPQSNDIPAYIVQSDGQRVSFNLNQLVAKAKQQPKFGDEEVTIFITGYPGESQTVAKATRKLVQAYLQRYNMEEQQQQHKDKDYDYANNAVTSSEEDYSESSRMAKKQDQNTPAGNIVVIDLGAKLTSFKRIAMLDVERTGAMIGRLLVQLTNEADVPQEIIHLVAQGIAAHVAGEAGRQYSRSTGHQLRRITALDPSKIYAKRPNTLTGLARGDAEFVDAIHTSAYGMGTPARVGDVDFYPNGPSAAVPGADNILEASVRATRYFAESLRQPRNFPAVAATTLKQYQNNNGNGPRAYMGIDTDYDVEGDYVLQVNSKSPFGKNAPAEKQNEYHKVHTPQQMWDLKSQN